MSDLYLSVPVLEPVEARRQPWLPFYKLRPPYLLSWGFLPVGKDVPQLARLPPKPQGLACPYFPSTG